jgi:hypothetical protein
MPIGRNGTKVLRVDIANKSFGERQGDGGCVVGDRGHDGVVISPLSY